MNQAQLTLDLGEIFDKRPASAGQLPLKRIRYAGVGVPFPDLSGTSNVFSPASAVLAFHKAFSLPRRANPNIADLPQSLIDLRIALLEEEVSEFKDAALKRDLVGAADALADVVYVAYGAAITLGIDLDMVVAEVHRANMSKLDEHGQPVMRADGKVCKSNRYRPPDIVTVLATQLPLPID
jgi:predicted HAD superfamily Cof-like phosphohydrolase